MESDLRRLPASWMLSSGMPPRPEVCLPRRRLRVASPAACGSNRSLSWQAVCAVLITFCVCHRSLSQTIPSAPSLDLSGRVQDRRPIPSTQEDPREAAAYAEVLAAVQRTTPAALAKDARRDVTFAHLFEEPAKYRGQVIRVGGRLRRVRHFDAPKFIQDSYGIGKLYEGWLFETDVYGANPRCVIFTKRPEGIEVREDTDHRVAFDGYFFKRYRYQAGDGWRDAPLFIAPTLTLTSSPSATDGSGLSIGTLATGFVGLIVATAATALVLGWWYCRGDRRLRARLRQGSRLKNLDTVGGTIDDFGLS